MTVRELSEELQKIEVMTAASMDFPVLYQAPTEQGNGPKWPADYVQVEMTKAVGEDGPGRLSVVIW